MPSAPAITKSYSIPTPSSTTTAEPPSPAPAPTIQKSNSRDDSTLGQENTQLRKELREARELIRNLELQVEAQRANARKAAQALLDAA